MQVDLAARRPVVLVLIKGLGIGGAEKLISEGARWWDRASFDYRVAYLLPWKDQLAGELEAQSVPVRCIGSKRGLTASTVLGFRRLLSEWGADLVHAHLPAAGILARVTARIPVVYTEHNLAWSYRRLTRTFNRLTYRWNDAITAVSAAVAESVTDYPGPTVTVVANGVAVAVPPEARARARAELELEVDEPLVVHVGNIRPGKGHEVLIEAAALLRAGGVKAKVVSIGVEKRAGDLARLRSLVRDNGLEGSMKLLGRRSDALEFIAAADVYVNPAEIEGLPVTILEALALGRPVVATGVGGIPSVVRDEITGLTVEPGRPDLLAEAIKRLLNDREAARRMAEAGVGLVSAEYGLESMIRAYEAIYQEVLG